MLAASKKLQKRVNCNTFEVFGYDFMLDNSADLYLIEANSNPCIEESNLLLKELVPRMISKKNNFIELIIIPIIDDTFRITVD